MFRVFFKSHSNKYLTVVFIIRLNYCSCESLRGNDHLIKFHLTFSVDQNFLLIQAFDRMLFWSVDQILFRLQVRLGQARLGQVRLGYFRLGQVIRSSEKCQKIWSTDYENFDQVKNYNFDQVKFDQLTPCLIPKKPESILIKIKTV